MYERAKELYASELASIREAGLYKAERVITTPQGARISSNGKQVLNFCANNYLGLSSHPRVIEGAKQALESHGFGMSSVRFICGTQDLHKQLEARIAASSAPKTRSSTRRASTPTAVCSRRCSAPRTPSSAMRSTTPASSTASASARRSACATPMATWRRSKPRWSRRRAAACA